MKRILLLGLFAVLLGGCYASRSTNPIIIQDKDENTGGSYGEQAVKRVVDPNRLPKECQEAKFHYSKDGSSLEATGTYGKSGYRINTDGDAICEPFNCKRVGGEWRCE